MALEDSSVNGAQLAEEILSDRVMSVEQSLQLLHSKEAQGILAETLQGIKAITQSSTDLDVIKSVLPSAEINNALLLSGGTVAGAIVLIIAAYTIFQGIRNSIIVPIASLFGVILTYFVWVNSMPFLNDNNIFAWLYNVIQNSGATGSIEGFAYVINGLSQGWGVAVYLISLIIAEKIYFSFSKVASNNYIIDGMVVALVSKVPMFAAKTALVMKVITVWLSLMSTFLISSAIFYTEFREGAWLMRYSDIETNPMYPKLLEAGKWFYEMVDIHGFTSLF